MDLVEYLISSGIRLERASGVEYFGPCPFCNEGNDRFRVFRDGGGKNATVPGHFFCRVCNAKGDHISWLMDIEGKTYREASGQDKNRTVRNCPLSHEKNWTVPKTRGTVQNCPISISDAWKSRAEAVLSSAMQEISSPGARGFYGGERGLTPETCEALGLGWQSHDRFFDTEAWGLPAGEKLVVPAGALMPVRREGRVVSLQVRRLKPYTPKGSSKPMKHHHTKGGAQVPFICGPVGAPLVVVESVLCAASVFQATGGAVAAVALCGATKGNTLKLDKETVEALKSAEVVLVAGDRDEAGEKVLKSLLEVRPDAFPYSVPSVINDVPISDPNDLLKVCGDKVLKGWVLYGIQQARTARGEPFGQARQESEGETPASSSSAKQGEAHATESKEASIEVPDTVGEVLNNVEPAEPVEAVEVVERDTFAETVAVFREAFPDGPPMIAPDMPNWPVFCRGYYHGCFTCPYSDSNPNGSPCTIWEACFPGVVKWYPPTY